VVTTVPARQAALTLVRAVAATLIPSRGAALSLARAAVATATAAFARALTSRRTFAVRLPVAPRATVALDARLMPAAGTSTGPSDYPSNDQAKAITGQVRNSVGVPIPGALVWLYRASDDYAVASTFTGTDGRYRFPRDTADPHSYYVVVWAGSDPGGVTRRDLRPA
jgi:hypothetical protein